MQAEAQPELRRAELTLAELEYSRAAKLVERDAVSQELAGRRRTSHDIAKAAVGAAVAQAGAVIESSRAVVRQLEATLADADLFAPRGGRVQYRLAQEGEVLPAGGKVMTITDLTDIYITIFLPARDAGLLQMGDEARIILDPIPDYVIPASATFVSSSVNERSKLGLAHIWCIVDAPHAIFRQALKEVAHGVTVFTAGFSASRSQGRSGRNCRGHDPDPFPIDQICGGVSAL